MIVKVTDLSQMSKEHGLKPIDRCLSFKDLRRMARSTQRFYFYRRRFSKYPNLWFEEREQIIPHQYNEDGICQNCGQKKPTEPDQPNEPEPPTETATVGGFVQMTFI